MKTVLKEKNAGYFDKDFDAFSTEYREQINNPKTTQIETWKRIVFVFFKNCFKLYLNYFYKKQFLAQKYAALPNIAYDRTLKQLGIYTNDDLITIK